jgi:hypothetical protein
MKYQEATRRLRALGCQELPRRSPGSHRKWYNPATDRIAPLPDWGSEGPQGRHITFMQFALAIMASHNITWPFWSCNLFPINRGQEDTLLL